VWNFTLTPSPTGALRQASVAESGHALACKGAVMSEEQHPKVDLKVVVAPQTGAIVTAPPVLIASVHTVNYCCGNCSTVLMHAERGQVHNLLIKCNECGSYNSTDI
jgi:hypothetical protein